MVIPSICIPWRELKELARGPFHPQNREWLVLLLKSYVAFLGLTIILGVILGGIESDINEGTNGRMTRYGAGVWLATSTFHGISYGELHPKTGSGKGVVCVISLYGWFFQLLVLSITLLSQLGAGRAKMSVSRTPKFMIQRSWPSFIVYSAWVVVIGLSSKAGIQQPDIDAERSRGFDDAIYFAWVSAFGNSFGDIYPTQNYANVLIFFLGAVRLFYTAYLMVLFSCRLPSSDQHQALLQAMREASEATPQPQQAPIDISQIGVLVGPGYLPPQVQDRDGKSGREMRKVSPVPSVEAN